MLSKKPGSIFVTGATGFVGSHFVREWLRTEQGRVFALVRGKGAVTGERRLATALETAHEASGGSDQVSTTALTAVDGDVTLPLAGVAQERVAQLRDAAGVEVFWHFASNLRYEDKNYEATRHVNVDGSRHALELAVAIGAKRFVYVSTAYVCGRRDGLIEEAPVPRSQEFSNGYEASKAEAEHVLVAECQRIGLPLTILRPSIVIGPRATQSAVGADAGLFSLIHAAMWVRSSETGRTGELRIPALADAEINFVPVDCVVADMLALSESGFGEKSIYHLTSSVCVSVGECWNAIADVTGMSNIVLSPPGSFKPGRAEQLIARRVGFFLPYIDVDRRFARALDAKWAVRVDEFAGYVRKAVARVESASR